MKDRKHMALGAIGAAFLLLAAASAPAGPWRAGVSGEVPKNVQTKKLQAGTTAPGKLLRVDRSQAEVTVTGWDKNEIAVEATVEVGNSDPEFVKEFLDNTTMTLEPEGAGFVLRLTSPLDRKKGEANIFKKLADAMRSGRWEISYAARIGIRVPAGQSLEVDNHFGNVGR